MGDEMPLPGMKPGSMFTKVMPSAALTRTSASTMWPSARAHVDVSATTPIEIPETSEGG